MKILSYTLLLDEPVLANTYAGDANSARSLNYIPGSLIRGALIASYLNRKDRIEPDNSFKSIFLSDNIRYLNAYPAGSDFENTYPAPLSWKVQKKEVAANKIFTLGIFNLAKETSELTDLVDFPYDFWWRRENTVYSYGFDYQLNVHTQRDAVYGKAREGSGAVFRYEALPAGLILKGAILFDASIPSEVEIDTLINKTVLLGKARTAGYGQARFIEVKEISLEEWKRDLSWKAILPSQETSKFILTFLSPALLKDEFGNFAANPSSELSLILNTSVTIDAAFSKSEVVGGFNRTWGLPSQQVIAISAGSTFSVNSQRPITAEALEKLEWYGLGDRRNEGFGRLVVDIDQPGQISWRESNRPGLEQTNSKMILSLESNKIVNFMLARLLRRELDNRILQAAREAVRNYLSGTLIPKSQISKWRVIVRDALGNTELAPQKKIERLTKYYSKEQSRQTTSWKKMERARLDFREIEQVRLSEWMFNVLTEENSPWKYLGYGISTPQKKIGSVVLKANEDLGIEYRLLLLDTILAACSKKTIGSKGELR